MLWFMSYTALISLAVKMPLPSSMETDQDRDSVAADQADLVADLVSVVALVAVDLQDFRRSERRVNIKTAIFFSAWVVKRIWLLSFFFYRPTAWNLLKVQLLCMFLLQVLCQAYICHNHYLLSFSSCR